MKKKEIDYAKIVVLETKIEELKNKILLKYINSINENENNAFNEMEILNSKIKRDKKMLKEDKKNLRDFKMLRGMLCLAGGLFTFAVSFTLPVLWTLLLVGTILLGLREYNRVCIKPFQKSIFKRQKRIRKNKEQIETDKYIISESRRKLLEVSSKYDPRMFQKLEIELLKSGYDMERIYEKYVQTLEEYNKIISDYKVTVEDSMNVPVMVDTVNVLYETNYEKAKNKSLQLKK